jgi:TonB family protein
MKQYKISFILVLFAHLSLFITYIYTFSPNKKVGLENITTINAHVYFTSPRMGKVSTEQQMRKAGAPQQLHLHNKPFPTPNTLPTTATVLKTKNDQNTSSQKINSMTSGQKDELLMLLHNAITHAQIYPQEALIQGQSGEVSLRFKLFPNGMIDQLYITKSSGFSSLDTAAMNTVKKIIPFEMAKNFLKNPEFFELPIDFQG